MKPKTAKPLDSSLWYQKKKTIQALRVPPQNPFPYFLPAPPLFLSVKLLLEPHCCKHIRSVKTDRRPAHKKRPALPLMQALPRL